MRVCFITDGGPTLGMGHVQQSLSLADALRPKAEITFLTKSGEAVLSMIRAAGFEVTALRSDEEILSSIGDSAPDVVIFDKIDVDENLAIAIKRTSPARLVIFTNLTDANRHADVAVTADIGSQFENVVYTDPETGTRYYYGPRFWVMRPEFHEYAKKGKKASRNPTQILVMFGGSDPANLTTVVLERLLGMERSFDIKVILGANFSHEGDVDAVLRRNPAKRSSVTILRNARNVAELMYAADLVLASPGLSVFEALRVGTPVIVMPQDELQRDTYRGFMQMLERSDVDKLDDLIENGRFTYPNESHITRMEIGEGVAQLVDEILPGGVTS